MPRLSPLTYLPILDRALETEIGIGFVVGGIDRRYFRQILNDARKASGDPRYDEIITFLPAAPHDNEIWVCKKHVELDDAPTR